MLLGQCAFCRPVKLFVVPVLLLYRIEVGESCARRGGNNANKVAWEKEPREVVAGLQYRTNPL